MAQNPNASPESQSQDSPRFESTAQQQQVEQSPQSSFESQPAPGPAHPEQEPGVEQKTEQQVEAADQDSQIVLPPVVDSTDDTDDSVAGVDDHSQDSQTDSTGSSIPAVAEDVDVIEKAWVNKAKQIINETKNDPHAQEEEFEKLQIEYHKKRYGRDIKATR